MKIPRRVACARPRLDQLEDRNTPSVSLVGTNLLITGTARVDNVLVTKVTVNGVATIRVNEGGTKTDTDFSKVTTIEFNGGDGNDHFVSLVSLKTTANGQGGNDVISTGGGDDTINGGAG